MTDRNWTVLTTETFEQWLFKQDIPTQDKVLATLLVLQHEGPFLGRPYVDSIKGSKYPNMKELRIQHLGKPIRAFFAFDSLRQAVVLCAGYKHNDKLFYEHMIKIADDEFSSYLMTVDNRK